MNIFSQPTTYGVLATLTSAGAAMLILNRPNEASPTPAPRISASSARTAPLIETQAAEEVRAKLAPRMSLENKGWQHVADARSTGDGSHYREALGIAAELEGAEETKFAGMLLRGHVLHQMHRFADARVLAESLVSERGMHTDHGLLGDILLDMGDVTGAIAAYEKQMALRPGLEAYARAAQVRWLKGQTGGAIEAMAMAASAGSARNPEPVAWTLSLLALYQCQTGADADALASADAALRLSPGHPRALVAKARIEMGRGRFAEALPLLNQAAARLPEPATLWLLTDCLKATGDQTRAARMESGWMKRAAKEDPRTLALYLATVGEDAARALQLAQAELKVRQDVFTHDAVAWAALAAGKPALARDYIALALAEGTVDARLCLHAGLIARASGDGPVAERYLDQAKELRHMLFPAERHRLDRAISEAGQLTANLTENQR